MTSKEDADRDTFAFTKQFEKRSDAAGISIINGYNLSHFAGGGDILQSIAQTFHTSVSDLDKNTILRQIHSQITTQKILLVGHSQGTFYTNEIYRYFLEHGVKEGSVAVYNLATPANYVEGLGGRYLTSTNDKAINSFRTDDIRAGAPVALPGNITIPLPSGEENDGWGGHHFQSDYLNGAPDRIVSDITKALGGLKPLQGTAPEGCFVPPPETIGDTAQRIALTVLDPPSQKAVAGAVSTGQAIAAATQKAYAAATALARSIANALAHIIGNTRVSAASQGAAAALVVSPAPTPNIAPKPDPAPSTGSGQARSPQGELAPPIVSANAQQSPPPPPIPLQTPAPPPSAAPPPPPVPSQPLVPITVGFGGGGGAASAPAPAPASPTPVNIPLSITAPNDNSVSATSSVTFTGATSAGFVVALAYGGITTTATADENGGWSATLALPEGTTAVAVVAADPSGDTSNSVARTVTIDTTPPPAPSPSAALCANSLSASVCLVATTTALVSWNDVSGASYYGYSLSGSFGTTTGTSAAFTLSNDASNAIAVAAYDAVGNAATSAPLSIYAYLQPLLINEVAWAGTKSSASDEWLELKNRSPFALDLSSVVLAAADGSPSISFSGPLSSGSFYLLERREEATGVASNAVNAFDQLSNDGEELFLSWRGTRMDQTPAVSVCGGWCAGTPFTLGLPFMSDASTMERRSGSENGAAAASWQSGVRGSSTTDADGAELCGTPGGENGASGSCPPPPFIIIEESL